MDGVRFNGAAAAVRPRAFVDATHSIPSRNSVSTVDAGTVGSQLHLPALEHVSSLRRQLRSDAPASTSRPRRPLVATTAVSSDLKKLARRRSKGRVATVEAVDPDVDADGLLNDSLYARLEAAYRQPSFSTLMSDFEAKLGDSILKYTDIESWDTGAVESESRSGLGAASSSIGCRSSNGTVADMIPGLVNGDMASSSNSSPKTVKKLGNSTLQDTDIGSWDIDGSAVESQSRSELGASSIPQSIGCRTSSQVADMASSSTSSPKAVKKRGSSRHEQGNRILKITKNPAVTRRSRKMAAIPKETVTDTPVVVERGGKRRLSLTSRIAMKQNKQSDNSSSAIAHSKSMNPEDQELWSQEIDDLINEYTTTLDLTAPLWDNLDRGLLTAAEENRLAMHMKPMKKLEKLHKVLMKQLGREPTDEEWASAAGVELSILRRRLALGRASRVKLIQRNLRLVLSQAFKYYKESMSLSIQDLCQEGVVGLMQAVDKFDPGRGYRFSTYGIYWIRNSILRAQTKSGHMLRSPHNVSTHRVNIKRAKVELATELGRPPTNEEIQKHLGITADRFRDILRTNMRTSSLHEHDRVTGREKVENLVSDEDALSTYARGTSIQYGLDDVLDSLRPKENLVLRQRYGLDGKGQRSLSEVGLVMNLSREMVRRHELRGILKLQHPTRVEYLRNYLN